MRMDSFPQILFSAWESGISGRILIKNRSVKEELPFKSGSLVVAKDALAEKAFLSYLVKGKVLDNPSAKRCETQAARKKTTLLEALYDLDILSLPRLWKTMRDFSTQNLFPLFDMSPLESSLVSEETLPDAAILFTIPTLSFIREGISRMTNMELIDALLPKDGADFQKLDPDHMDRIDLDPYEERLLHAVSKKEDPAALIAASPFGEKYAKKALFSLYCLGALGPSPMATPNKPLQEFSAVELQKILISFNAKCSYIYKSVSKELGPVALNLMEKSIEDIKPALSPHFRKIRLGANGKIDLQSVLKSNIILSDRDTIQSIIKSLNEILSAEILAVKKTLGSEFESNLINGLEKIGG